MDGGVTPPYKSLNPNIMFKILKFKEKRAKVKGINIIKKHVKTTKEKKGGIIEKENFINMSNLVIVDIKKKSEIKK